MWHSVQSKILNILLGVVRATGHYPVDVGGRVRSQVMKKIAFSVRIMETTGLSLSIIMLCASIVIVCRFRYVVISPLSVEI